MSNSFQQLQPASQPPRSAANPGLSRGGFGMNSLSGHVTPTSGMFPSSFTPQQLSPNRSINMGSRMFGQRNFTDRRTMPGLSNSNSMASMGSFGIPPNRTYGSQGTINSFHSVFGGSGGGGDTSTPPLLDLSEFPSLNRGQGDTMPQPNPPMPGKQPYASLTHLHQRNLEKVQVGMVKQPTNEASEFTMSSEDFPALPGTQNQDGPSPGGSVSGEKGLPGVIGSEISGLDSSAGRGTAVEKATKRGIQTSPDGKVTNVPASMVKDQFGMVGLLTFIRAAETDPNLVSLALGQDLTALGLNLNSPDNLYPTFGGPWADTPCRPQDIDFHVPPEYLVNASIREKLPPIRPNRYKDDLLFYLFYTNPGDVLQIAAAAELYNREWRYHMEEKVWITQAPGMQVQEKTSTYERGTYYYFDPQNWRRVAKEFHLDYSKLEGRPHLPPSLLPMPGVPGSI